MDRRTNSQMRLRIDQLLTLVASGRIGVSEAGRRMDLIGVPFAVACRVLVKATPQPIAA